ncbi:LysE family translocator [Alteribacter aurantiacus]|uniref:LysE family translocator n=1 Tax=Alteribacter aurantiacus TaxID=254410 RepID=UPI00040F3999|nr:LysE family transporter [Alteribacter aurantiacus]
MIFLLVRQVVLGLSIAAPIGPINIEIIRRGIYQGFWPSLLVGAGGMSADFILMFLMYQGLSLFLTLEAVQLSLLVLGAFILTYTGVKGLLSSNQSFTGPVLDMRNDPENTISSSLIHAYLTGLSIASFNPLNLLFWLGIYGSVLSETFSDENRLRAFIISSAVFLGIGLWNLNLACTVHFGKKLMSPRALHGICLGSSAILIAFGMYFIWKAAISFMAFFTVESSTFINVLTTSLPFFSN